MKNINKIFVFLILKACLIFVYSTNVDMVVVGTDITYGKYLKKVANNMSLYIYTPDNAEGVSNCYDACAITWPPL